MLIFTPSSWSMPLCSQYPQKGALPVALSACAISFSWWGKSRSRPPPWMSIWSPRCPRDIAVHSMLQPGRPSHQGLGQLGSSGSQRCQRRKSSGPRFFSSRFDSGFSRFASSAIEIPFSWP